MTEPYLFEKAIGQQMGDLCRLAVGEGKVTKAGEIVTLEDMLGRGAFGVSVEVPYTEGGVQSVSVTRCGKNLAPPTTQYTICNKLLIKAQRQYVISFLVESTAAYRWLISPYDLSDNLEQTVISPPAETYWSEAYRGYYSASNTTRKIYEINTEANGYITARIMNLPQETTLESRQVELGSAATAYEPYNGDTYTITMPAGFYGGTVNLEVGTVTSRYAADGTDLAEPVVTETDPISIPILAGVNNVWADVGTVTVSYYAADAQSFRPALWYPTIYRGLTSARYLIKRASGAIASFDDAIAAPLVGLRVALPYDAEGYQSVSVTRCGKNLLNWQLPTSQFTNLVFTLGINGRTTLRISGILSTPTVQGSAFIGYVLNGNKRYQAWGDVSIPLVCRFDGNLSSITILNWGGIRGTIEEAQLELGSTATDYEPYNGDTYTITLPATIYGGYLDVVTGQLVATHDENGNLLANQKLYFLPPTNISALAGVNNIWSDAGDVAVSYRIDNG